MNNELRKAKILAKQALAAETKAEYAEKRVIRKRKELSAYLSAIKRKAELRRKQHKISLEKALKEIAYKKKYEWKKKIWKKMNELEDEGLSDEEVRDRYNQWKRTGKW